MGGLGGTPRPVSLKSGLPAATFHSRTSFSSHETKVLSSLLNAVAWEKTFTTLVGMNLMSLPEATSQSRIPFSPLPVEASTLESQEKAIVLTVV